MCQLIRWLVLFYPLLAAQLGEAVNYELDHSWRPAFPNGTSSFNAVDAVGDTVYVGQRNVNYPDPVLVFNRAGGFLSSFGAKDVATGIHHDELERGIHGLSVQLASPGLRENNFVYVMDFFNHTVLSYTPSGELISIVGDGASADWDKFDSPADAAFRNNSVFFVDGDGGVNMRASAWTSNASGMLETVEWVNPPDSPAKRQRQEFDHPHSICWHQSSDKLLVADRDHWRIAVLNPESGAVEGNFTCPLDLGPAPSGRPFGLRTFRRDGTGSTPALDLLFVAVSGNDQIETEHQFLYVVDVSSLGSSNDFTCDKILQTITIDPEYCAIPHLLGVDQVTGEVYMACNKNPNSNVIRFANKDSY